MKTDRNLDRKGPGRRPANIPVSLKVEFVPIPEDRIGAWRAAMRLLLELLREEKELLRKEGLQNGDDC